MDSHVNDDFRDLFRKLSPDLKRDAKAAYRLWQQEPFHPSLHFKEVAEGIYSVRVGLHWRALAVREGNEVTWIGSHAEYDHLLRKL